MCDWLAIYNNRSDTFNSVLNMNMPGGYAPGPFDEEHKFDNYGRNHSFWTPLEEYVKTKKVDEKRVNESVTRIIAAMYKMNQTENYPKLDLYKETKTEERKKLQRKAELNLKFY